MHISSLTSIIVLGLAAVSSSLVIERENHNDLVARENSDAISAQDPLSIGARAAPVCKKKGTALTIPKLKTKSESRSSSEEPAKKVHRFLDNGNRSLDKRATQLFEMNRGPRMGYLNEPQPLKTKGLMGCSVVIIASTTHVFATHCSRGKGTFDQQNIMGPDYVEPEYVAAAAINEILDLYAPHKVAAGNRVKAMLITADQPYTDNVAAQMQADLIKGGISDVKWYRYNAMAISEMPETEREAAGALTVNAAGAVVSPTPPTAADAEEDIKLSRIRFRHLSALNAQSAIEDLLQQWEHPTSPTNFKSCGAIAAAITNGLKQLLKYFVDSGFSLLETEADNVACEYAVRTGDLEILEIFSRVLSNTDIVLWFLNQGADPNAWCHYALSAVTSTAREGTLSTLKLLVSHGGTITSTDAVTQAVVGDVIGFPDRLEMVDDLVDLDAPIDAYRFCYTGSNAPSLIHIFWGGDRIVACGDRRKKEMVELLLGCGADKTKRGGFRTKEKTAFEIAEAAGLSESGTRVI
ncbi:hypothetical protein BJ878DRAFT_544895 [Calycina marina]|uniref:Uncharacterized protein n=1 Tax=Calycina marina TaxID=1763456 RepID=A0A9P7YY04_9HELO|nr:hypothetical protein BJ878DRAFT_544895 [Calycina marina]